MSSFFDRDPRSHNFLASAHGRVEAGMIGLKLVLSIVFTLDSTFGGTFMVRVILHARLCAAAPPPLRFGLPPTLLQVLSVLVAAVVHWYLYLHYLPFYKPSTNYLHAVFAAVFGWGAICLAVAKFDGRPVCGCSSPVSVV